LASCDFDMWFSSEIEAYNFIEKASITRDGGLYQNI
jgi:hypothetical protein